MGVEAEENLYAALGTLSPVTTCIFRNISLTIYTVYSLKIDRSVEKKGKQFMLYTILALKKAKCLCLSGVSGVLGFKI